MMRSEDEEVKTFEPARRSFLRRCCQAAAALLVPTKLRKTALARPNSPPPDFHLHPHYREQTPLDTALLHIKPGLDGVVIEKHHDSIAAVLNDWSASLIESPRNTGLLEAALSEKFAGASWQAIEPQRLRRTSSGLEVHRVRFAAEPLLGPADFMSSLRSALNCFSKILTAEFHVTAIGDTAAGLATRVRYELIGTGPGFYREQRIGQLSVDWEPASENNYRLLRWRAHEEVRSRSSAPFYSDVTRHAFGSNASYAAQMLHGADYWRTVLDGACGIDVYGHNGVSVGDIDGDGWDDIYVCQAAGLPNRLYRNRRDGTFEDITEASGVGLLDNTACALFADFDNDGLQDLVVVQASGPLLFLNQGNGKFRLKPGAFQFATPPQGTFTGAAAADYNRDGWLDIYFCLYIYYEGADQYKYPVPYFAAENGPPNFLMHNNGDGTFRDVTPQCGLDKNNTRYSFCCAWGDYNNDGWADLYVVNDFGRKNLYRNNGDGTFTDVAPQAGVEDVGAGMSVCWLDYDNDGAEDLYVANMWSAAGERITAENGFQKNASKQIQAMYRQHAMGNSLFGSRADGEFRDRTEESGTGMGRWSWSSDAWDFDHDGFPDIYIANGMISGAVREDLNSFFWRQVIAKSPNSERPSAEYEQAWNVINQLIRSDYTWSGFERNVFYANNGNGTFSDISGTLGLDFFEDARAFVVADFDGDGRQELLLKNRNAPQLRLMKNIVSDLPPAIVFRLRGRKSNRDAIGAAVTIETSSGRQTRFLRAGSGFLSQHSKDLFFGLGKATGNISASIRWPSGIIQQLKDLPPNHRVSVIEGSKTPSIEPFKPRSMETSASADSWGETLPELAETWLLAPVPAPDFSLADGRGKTWTLPALRGKPVLLTVSDERPQGSTPPFFTVSTSTDLAATYNLLFRFLFDRHRDLLLPTSFLIDENGLIVKVYQGRVDAATVERDFDNMPRTDAGRLATALPFAGVSETFEFGRNYLSLGAVFFQRGYMECSEVYFQAALKGNPASAEAFYGIGSVYLKQGNTAQAGECFERAAKLKTTYPETTANSWNNLGLLAARRGDTASAITYFEQALQVDPDHFVALENLGNAYKQEKRWDEAQQTLERALAIKPDDAEANYSLGMVFAQLDDKMRSYEYLQKALEIRPSYPEALNNLGVLYLRSHRPEEAVAAFEKCILVAPGFDQAYLNLARVYEIEGETEKARGILLALLKQHPGHVLAQQSLTQLH
jgi:tetratricopeptide (TPR) repeat protein